MVIGDIIRHHPTCIQWDYGSEGWEFDSLRARHRNTTSEQVVCHFLRFFSVADVDLYPQVYPRAVLAFTP
jgi:hypothetical protein